jgi:protein arginine kinase activator
MHSKPCQICGKALATIHLTEIENNTTNEIHVCEKCAEEKGFHGPGSKGKLSIVDQFLQLAAGAGGDEFQVQCRRCGLTFSEFRRVGRLGCSQCYASFQAQLRPILRKVHGSVVHVGKAPVRDESRLKRLREVERLQEDLERAIRREEYERAAEIRDRLRTVLESETSGGSS